jgi:hypothetical protein
LKLNRLGIFLFLLCGFMLQGEGNSLSFNGSYLKKHISASVCGFCGKAISGEYISYKNGSAYHRECHEIAKRCKICGLPIGRKQKAKSDTAGNAFHSACYKNASFCVACGEPITAGQSYRKTKSGDTILHKRCFENSSFCGITGKYIQPGVKTVRLGPEIFIKSEYDKSPKCIVSALPLANHGQHIINRRSKSYVLEKYKKQTRQCYSCGDWLPDGYIVGNQLFLCKYCYQHSVKDKEQADRYFEEAISFLREKGIRIPKNIEIVILPPGQRVSGQDSIDMKGACNTEVTFVGQLSFYTHTVEILYGLNYDRFATTLVHELSHSIIAEEIKYLNHREQVVPYEEGRCEYTAYRFAKERDLPGYIVDGFALNRITEYREGFLYFSKRNPANLKSVLTIK